MAEPEDTIKAEQKARDKAKAKLNRIRETNATIIEEIQSMGVEPELTMPRLEHFMVFLVQLGLMTEDDLLNEAYHWERNLKEQIGPMVRKMRERAIEARNEAQRRQAEAAKVAKDQPKVDAVPPKVDGKRVQL